MHASNIKAFSFMARLFLFIFFSFPRESWGYCCLLVVGFSMMPKCTELVCVFSFLNTVTNFSSQFPLYYKVLEK